MSAPYSSQKASGPSDVMYGSGRTAASLCQTTSKPPSGRHTPMRGVRAQ